MRCPFCRADNDRVIDTRASQDGFAIRRRRECIACGRRYTTSEQLEELNIKIIKSDGVREPFQREKIRRGLEKACWKRPISDETIGGIVAAVESQIYGMFENEIESRQLGDLIMEHLAELDEVAYVRFASVYRKFQDAHDFVDELQPILRQKAKSE